MDSDEVLLYMSRKAPNLVNLIHENGVAASYFPSLASLQTQNPLNKGKVGSLGGKILPRCQKCVMSITFPAFLLQPLTRVLCIFMDYWTLSLKSR